MNVLNDRIIKEDNEKILRYSNKKIKKIYMHKCNQSCARVHTTSVLVAMTFKHVSYTGFKTTRLINLMNWNLTLNTDYSSSCFL